MRRQNPWMPIVLLTFCLTISLQAQARQILKDLNLSQGRWIMVGVSLHNYNLLPMQLDLGTFIVKNPQVLKQMQEEWDFQEKFDDYCDYHYALKFYQNGDLQQTIKVNLVCGYISIGGLSYEFSKETFTKFKKHYKSIRWSRIRFKNLDLLQKSVDRLENIPGIYWYGDVQQYHFDGEFSITVNNLPWNTNRDSVINQLTENLKSSFETDEFYITTKYWLLSEDFETMTLRLSVFCNEQFYYAYKSRKRNIITHWRNHFSEQNFVQLVVIGLNQKEYFKYMRGS